MVIDELLGHGDDVFGLGVVEADSFDVGFKAVYAEV